MFTTILETTYRKHLPICHLKFVENCRYRRPSIYLSSILMSILWWFLISWLFYQLWILKLCKYEISEPYLHICCLIIPRIIWQTKNFTFLLFKIHCLIIFVFKLVVINNLLIVYWLKTNQTDRQTIKARVISYAIIQKTYCGHM